MVATRPRLSPLRWIAEESLVYDEDSNELHKRDCPSASPSIELEAGEALELIWAPKICASCRPDVTTGLAL